MTLLAISGGNFVRGVVAVGCLTLVGVNMAFVVHAKRLFAPETYSTWRLFFLGKSLMTAFVGLSIWTRVASNAPLSWRMPLAFAGLGVTNLALYKLYKVRALAHIGEETAWEVEHHDV